MIMTNLCFRLSYVLEDYKTAPQDSAYADAMRGLLFCVEYAVQHSIEEHIVNWGHSDDLPVIYWINFFGVLDDWQDLITRPLITSLCEGYRSGLITVAKDISLAPLLKQRGMPRDL